MWFVGIDWADQQHDVAVLDADGRVAATRRVLHSAEGLAQLTTWLRQLGEGATDLAGIVETRHGLLITALVEAGLAVDVVHPRTVGQMRAPSNAKTDTIDALLLAHKGRQDLARLRRLCPDSPLIAELKLLTRDQQALILSQTRLINQLIACLKAYYPVALHLFSKVHDQVTLRFLQRYPTPEQAQAATQPEGYALRRERHYPHAEAKAAQIWTQLHAPQLRADPITHRVKTRLMMALVAQLLLLMPQVADDDRELRRLFAQHADAPIFASIPGVGKRLGPRVLAEWGDDRERYQDAGSVQALAGTAPVLWQSGQYRKVRMRQGCVKPVRHTLHQLAGDSRQTEAWARDYVQRQRGKGKRYAMALRALATQWVRIIYAMWRTQTPYDRATFEAAQQAHRPRAA
jgi:hypothetical protein